MGEEEGRERDMRYETWGGNMNILCVDGREYHLHSLQTFPGQFPSASDDGIGHSASSTQTHTTKTNKQKKKQKHYYCL